MIQAASVAYVVCSILGMLAFLIPSPWHWRVKNRATLIMIGWGAIGNFTGAVTGAIFSRTFENVAPRWCDFAAAMDYVWIFGFGAGSVCLLRRLHRIASTKQVSQTEAEKRKNLVFECVVGIVLPLLLIPLHFVNQGHRMDIIEGHGCNAPLYHSYVSIFTFEIWQLVINTVAMVYGVLTLRWFLIRRRQFAAVLQSSHAGMSQSKYLRLMVMAGVEVLYGFPVSMYIFISGLVEFPVKPYISWAFIHEDFNTTYSIPQSLVPEKTLARAYLSRWANVIAAVIFFAFFGLGPEALKEYRATLSSIRRKLPRGKSPSRKETLETPAGRPSLSSRPTHANLSPVRWDEDTEKGWSPSSQKHAFETVQLQVLATTRSASDDVPPYVHVSTERIVTH